MNKVIAVEKIDDWLDTLNETHRIFAPFKTGGATRFEGYQRGKELDLERFAVSSPKEAFFPAAETIFNFKLGKENVSETVVSLESQVKNQNQIVFGARCCDAKGLATFDTVFSGSGYQDPYFKKKRNTTLLITIACHQPANTCFCTSVGGGPADPKGADVLLTSLDDKYLVQTFSTKAKTLLAGSFFTDATQKDLKEAKDRNEAARQKLKTFSVEGVSQKLTKIFESEYWNEKAAKCLSCGACTYTCPTCYCFNLTDEGKSTGERVRTWDSCMFPQFTLEASGHNPRPRKAHRLRNRINHKFSYFPTQYRMLSCVGCGRCIRHCPVSVDIREIVRGVQEV